MTLRDRFNAVASSVGQLPSKLVDITGLDTLVGELMRFYNEKFNTKTDKGGYEGTANDIKELVDTKADASSLSSYVRKSGETITGVLKTTKPDVAMEFSSTTSQAQYMQFKKGSSRKVYMGFPAANDQNKFSIFGEDNAWLEVGGFANLKARLNFLELGQQLRLGHGAGVASISPEDNSTKTLRFFNDSVGQNSFFNLESMGTLEFNTKDSNNNRAFDIKFKRKGANKGSIGYTSGKIFMHNASSQKTIELRDNGHASYPAMNLNTDAKEIVGAINELLVKITALENRP